MSRFDDTPVTIVKSLVTVLSIDGWVRKCVVPGSGDILL